MLSILQQIWHNLTESKSLSQPISFLRKLETTPGHKKKLLAMYDAQWVSPCCALWSNILILRSQLGCWSWNNHCIMEPRRVCPMKDGPHWLMGLFNWVQNFQTNLDLKMCHFSWSVMIPAPGIWANTKTREEVPNQWFSRFLLHHPGI